jgi:phosphocarrier protein
MESFEITVLDDAGIHARPAGELVKTATKFDSNIKIINDDKEGDLKRIFSVMALGTKKGETVTIEAEGPDATEAIAAVEKSFKDQKLDVETEK